MAQPPEKDTPAAHTANQTGAAQAPQKPAAQASPAQSSSAQHHTAAPKLAPQQRTLSGAAAPQQAVAPGHPLPRQAGAPASSQAANARTVRRMEPSKPTTSRAPKQTASEHSAPRQTGEIAQIPHGTVTGATPTATDGTQNSQQRTSTSAVYTPDATGRASLSEASPRPAPKARPRKRLETADAAPRATRNTVPLHSTAILQLEQIARSMQRGVNDGALVEAEAADRLPFRLVVNAMGQVLYRIGMQAEYAFLRIWRTVCHALHLLSMGILLLLRTFLRPIGVLLSGVWHDVTSPLVRLFVGIGHAFTVMRAASNRGENVFKAGVAFAKQGFKAYRHVGATALSYLLPIAAAAVLTLTVWSVLNTPFSLAVTYNDKMIGYVENEAVWETAKKKVTDRIRASSPDESFDVRPQFNVVSVQVAARRSALEMVNVIISESPDQIQNATGVYVGDTLAGVCADGAGVQQMLDTTLSAALPSDDPTARVEFLNAVTTEAGLYYTDSISTLTQLESTLQANNWLQVKLLRTEVHTDPIPFELVEEENPNAYKGSKRVKQVGVDGEKIVTDDVSYINGVEIDRVTLSEEIIKEPVARITTVGTKSSSGADSYSGPVISGSGVFIWPVPNYSYTTTEFGYHRGLDICAPYGSDVLACDSGTVVEAGTHWSWGNYILVDHGNGITTRYAHNSQLNVTVGSNVAQGQVIAQVGSTGFSSGNHCHLEVAINGSLVNPRRYFP